MIPHVTQNQDHGLDENYRPLDEKMIEDDFGKFGVASVCIQSQEALHGNKAHVHAYILKVVQQLRVLDGQQLVDYLDLRAK